MSCTVRLVSRFDKQHELSATNVQVFSQASEQLPHESLGVQGGGTAPSDPRDESGKKTSVPQFELRADLMPAAQKSLHHPGVPLGTGLFDHDFPDLPEGNGVSVRAIPAHRVRGVGHR